jgi:hypothetical protein
MDTAIFEVEKLTEPEQQDALAVIPLAEIASERRWSESFARAQDALARLAAEALAEHAAGLTQPL